MARSKRPQPDSQPPKADTPNPEVTPEVASPPSPIDPSESLDDYASKLTIVTH